MLWILYFMLRETEAVKIHQTFFFFFVVALGVSDGSVGLGGVMEMERSI